MKKINVLVEIKENDDYKKIEEMVTSCDEMYKCTVDNEKRLFIVNTTESDLAKIQKEFIAVSADSDDPLLKSVPSLFDKIVKGKSESATSLWDEMKLNQIKCIDICKIK